MLCNAPLVHITPCPSCPHNLISMPLTHTHNHMYKTYLSVATFNTSPQRRSASADVQAASYSYPLFYRRLETSHCSFFSHRSSFLDLHFAVERVLLALELNSLPPGLAFQECSFDLASQNQAPGSRLCRFARRSVSVHGHNYLQHWNGGAGILQVMIGNSGPKESLRPSSKCGYLA